ncbi:type II secretion system protein GspG [Candidatus Poribacteria bacterium]|nr:type II secretion system protein GspG [Candidatus Poribacteria bacterium]
MFLFKVLTPIIVRHAPRQTIDIRVIAELVKEYKERESEFPYSLEQLVHSLQKRPRPGIDTFPVFDPWGREYLYFRISDSRVVLASKGPNGRLDTPVESFSIVSADDVVDAKEHGIYRLVVENDDCIYVISI